MRGLVTWLLLGLILASSAGAWPAGVDHSIFSDEGDRDETPRGMPFEGTAAEGGDTGQEDTRTARIIGISLLGSGLFLCSWGIAEWEVEEYQCCPAHNTGNIVKIVAGVVLLNAGLIYLLQADG